jgi:hypothetical protein
MAPITDFARDEDPATEFFISADKAMFGVDYPHFESILPSLTPTLAELLGHPAITHDHARKILFDNAANVYGFDRAVLQPHVDRVGFEVDDLVATNSG